MSSVLAKMTQLQLLKVYAAPQLTDKGLLALTALKGLTQLEAWGCSFSRRVSTENEAGCLKLYYEVSWHLNLFSCPFAAPHVLGAVRVLSALLCNM
jgi:hypothetical protein